MRQKLTAAGIEIYMSKLSILTGDYFHMLTPWQRKFITDVYDQFIEKPELSKKPMDQIDSIYVQNVD